MSAKGVERRGLGRGLNALMGDIPMAPASAPAIGPGARTIPVEDIAANPGQPRRRFSEAALNDLAASIRAKGILQPLILREIADKDQKYQIVAGERRWRAAQLAQLHEVPAIIRNFTDEEAMEVAIIENIQRDDLNPVEEASGYRSLMDAHGRTQEEMAHALGKSRSHIANMVRLLNLPERVLEHLAAGRLTIGHARALVTADDPVGLANQIVGRGLSVRDAEALAKGKDKSPPAPKRQVLKDADTRAIEDELSASLGIRVSIDAEPGGETGKLSIRYKNLDELDDLCRRLSNVRAGTI